MGEYGISLIYSIREGIFKDNELNGQGKRIFYDGEIRYLVNLLKREGMFKDD
jgi:hypothetical protein